MAVFWLTSPIVQSCVLLTVQPVQGQRWTQFLSTWDLSKRLYSVSYCPLNWCENKQLCQRITYDTNNNGIMECYGQRQTITSSGAFESPCVCLFKKCFLTAYHHKQTAYSQLLLATVLASWRCPTLRLSRHTELAACHDTGVQHETHFLYNQFLNSSFMQSTSSICNK